MEPIAPRKIENPARFFNYRLNAENTLATWVRNAMLTLRVALAAYLAFSNTTTVLLLSLSALGMLTWSLWRFYQNNTMLQRLVPTPRPYGKLDTIWILLVTVLAFGSLSLCRDLL